MSVKSLADRWKAPPICAGFTFLIGLAFWWLSRRPLWHTDLWGHLAYGRAIWRLGALPTTELLMPLAAGVPFVDTAWLSQLIAYAAHGAFGNAALQFLYAGGVAACLSLLARCCYRRTRCAGWTLAGCCLFAWVDWQQLQIIRPQLAGLVCFLWLLAAMTSRQWFRAHWVSVPVLFVVWANLHGSFPVGLAALGCFVLGRGVDVARRAGSLRAIVVDTRFRRYFALTGLALTAVLLNPYGWRLYAEVWSVSSSPNLRDLVEWQPLTVRMKQGRAAAAALLALVVVYRLSPRRISAVEVLLLAGLGGSALWASRFILWWSPIAGYCLALHGGAWQGKRKQGKRKKEKGKSQDEEAATAMPARSVAWTVVSVGLVLFFLAASPMGFTLFHGKQADPRMSFSARTPIDAAEYLRKHPPTGQVFNTFEWGDYLLWAGPEGIEVFVASHAHLVPRDVWRDYKRVIRATPGWEQTLDDYRVEAIVIDNAGHKSLIARLRRNADWQVSHEDRPSVVFIRKKDENSSRQSAISFQESEI